MNILYLSFGNNQVVYTQTQFSIQTIHVYHPDIKINVVTDHPEYFKRLSEHVDISIWEIKEQMFNQWTKTGGLEYLYRIKLKIVEQFVEEYPNTPFMFLDSDTFAYRPFDELIKALCANKAVMHEPEKRYADAQTKTERNVWRSIAGTTIGGIKITENMVGWNSGVIGIPSQNNKEAVKRAIVICDELCARVKRRNFVEQIAYSIALSSQYDLIKANEYIGHYWGNKDEWNAAITKFYMDVKMQGLSFDQEQVLIRNFDFSAIPYRKKESNTCLRLTRLIGKIFPDKDYLFVKTNT